MDLRLKKDDRFSWVIAYIDRDFLDSTEKQLSKFPEYRHVKAYIPTVKVLKKTVKNENHYENIPLLFNYGFFRLPHHLINAEALAKLKSDIRVIYSWVKDPVTLYQEAPSLNLENKTIRRPTQMMVGTASDEEISRLINTSHKMSIFDKDELDKVKVGDTILLKGFPWEGIPAKVMAINFKKEEIRVQMDFATHIQESIIAFNYVFWSIYQGSYDEENFKKEISLEEIGSKKKSQVDKVMKDGQE